MTTGPAPTAATHAPQKPGDLDPLTGKKILYWHDPMVPAQRFEHPGKSPFMDMQLVPVVEGRRRCRRRRDQSTPAAKPRRAHRPRRTRTTAPRDHRERQRRLRRARRGAGSGARQRLRGAPARARDRSIRCARASRSQISTCPTGSPPRTNTSPSRISRAPEPADLVDGARQRMRLAGMPEDLIRTAGEKRQAAIAIHAGGADQRCGLGAHGTRRHDRRDGVAALSHQWTSQGLGQRRGARDTRGTCASRRCHSGAHGGASRSASSMGQWARFSRGECGDPHAQCARGAGEPEDGSSCPGCS